MYTVYYVIVVCGIVLNSTSSLMFSTGLHLSQVTYFPPYSGNSKWGNIGRKYLGPPYADDWVPTPAALATSARLYDALRFVATGTDKCIQDHTCDLGIAPQLLAHLRSSVVEGITGNVALDGGGLDSNDRAVQPFALRNCRVERRSGSNGEGSRQVNSVCTHVGEVSGGEAKLTVCPSGGEGGITRMGPACSLTAEPPRFESWAPSSQTTIQLTWGPSGSNEEAPLSGYRITAFARGERAWADSLVVSSNVTEYTLHVSKTAVTTVGGKEPTQPATERFRVEHNIEYSFALQALYDESSVSTESTRSDNNVFLACLPSSDGSHQKVCGCRSTEFHTRGLPSLVPKKWRCETCPDGLECNGQAFDDVTTMPGWFAAGNQSNVNVNSSGSSSGTKRPQLYLCLGGVSACPGNVSTISIMARKEPLGQQCGDGHIGMLCAACSEGYSLSTDDNRCTKCDVNSEALWGAAAGIVVVLLLVVAAFALLFKRLSKRPLLEKYFLEEFHARTDTHGIEGGIADILCTLGGTQDEGITSGAFHSSCRKLLPAELQSHITKAHAEQFWSTLDIDDDGSVTAAELVVFAVRLHSEISTNKYRVVYGNVMAWWRSNRTRTNYSLLVGYLQLFGGVATSFPSYYAPSVVVGEVAVEDSLPDTSSTDASSIYNTVAQFFSVDINVLEFVRCMLGARYSSKLVFFTLAPLMIIVLSQIIPVMLRLLRQLPCLASLSNATA